jgi:hypothetical protein
MSHVQLYHGENKLSSMRWWEDDDDDDDDDVRFVLHHHAQLDFNRAHWNDSLRVDMSLHSDTSFWFQSNQSLLWLFNAEWLSKKQQKHIS